MTLDFGLYANSSNSSYNSTKNNMNLYRPPQTHLDNEKPLHINHHIHINNNNPNINNMDNMTTPVRSSFSSYQDNKNFTTLSPTNILSTNLNNSNMTSPKLQSPTLQTNQHQYSNLLKSICNPCVTTSFKPRENQFTKPKGCHLISSMELGKILSNKNDKDLLIFDTRPYSDRSKSYIGNSLHISLPSTLLRRKNFTLEKLIESLPLIEQNIIFDKLESPNLEIVLYNNTSNQTDSNISFALACIAIKILNYHKFLNCDRNMVLILESGFPHFEKLFPEFIVTEVHKPSDLTLSTNNFSTNNDPSTSFNSSSNKISPFSESFHQVNSSNFDFDKCLTPPLPSLISSNENTMSESPVSSSSPISALFKFQLPTSQTIQKPLFKFAQNEEIMNLESYLSAVNINEENQRLNSDILNAANLQEFQFPKRLSPESGTFNKASNKDSTNSMSQAQDKLNVQLKYEKLLQVYPLHIIDYYIPKWFQKLMIRPKIQFILQYQKLDILEKKRLNSSISKNTPVSIKCCTSTYYKDLHKTSGSDAGFTSPSNNKLKGYRTRSLSQPNIYSAIRKHSWLKDLDSDDEDEKDRIIISSGVELGNKNRYKDIFPYEHTRVHLKKASFDNNILNNSNTISEAKGWKVDDANNSIEEEEEEKEEDLANTYINANYLHVPDLDLTDTPPTTSINNSSFKVRYIATQAPMYSTVHDFYTCILNDNIPLILALTNNIENGIEKCFKYWKEENYDGIKVKLLEETNLSNSMIIRRIKLTYDLDAKSYQLLQVQLTNWPDLGIVKTSKDVIQLINLKNVVISKLRESKHWSYMSTPTILVHCSAGCGRTGTWCTIDSILSNLSTFNFLQNFYTSSISVYDPISWIINIFRKQRISMVQNINQFLFIYDCLLYYFTLQINDDSVVKRMEDNIDDKKLFVRTSLNELLKDIENLPILHNFIDAKISTL
ncbi:hypothetical protein RI543_000119 [Arxiozyma heterogenica]|uniref:protein-tyrosine-phosphatase n=1 Tax=Arxiozyma heterogenica TaxID=278026 RepID=A0AAN8A9V8_9SACH|nr:hypothetical protein RI543_000119 [Kazachstania heterogenica]